MSKLVWLDELIQFTTAPRLINKVTNRGHPILVALVIGWTNEERIFLRATWVCEEIWE